jgi:hypothetical protein
MSNRKPLDTSVQINDTVWPNPEDPSELEWKLRYGQRSLTDSDLMLAASFVSAYKELFNKPIKDSSFYLKAAKKEKQLDKSRPKYYLPSDEFHILIVAGGYQAFFKREVEQYATYQSPIYKYKKDAYEWCHNNYNAKQELLDKYIKSNWRKK